MRHLKQFALAAALTIAAAATLGVAAPSKPAHPPAKKHANVAATGVFQISSTLPSDIPGGASSATITQAATFAWQEFIALNWPAQNQNGLPNTRGYPNTQQNFGSDTQGQPLVWETLRSKVETFPGVGDPPGYQSISGIPNPDYGYDHLPVYTYGMRSADSNGNQQNPGGTPLVIAPCGGQSPVVNPAWVNLDEVNQIGEDTMYAGVVPNAATPTNSQPQLIRFLAKGNRNFYDYVAKNQYWYQNAGYNTAVSNFANAAAANKFPPPSPTISLPPGTILVKAAWRQLAPSENAADFHTQTVRYYESNGSGGQCYREATWALIALHLIQKTPSAPYFIFATFEYTNDILSTNGSPVEDINGNYIGTEPANPLNPPVNFWDADSQYYNWANPKGTNTVPPPAGQVLPVAQQGGNWCTVGSATTPQQNASLYYLNIQFSFPPTVASQQLPASGNSTQGFCVDRRNFSIPPQIVAANAAAHSALAGYGAPGRWQNYKLVNVQYQPFNQSDIDTTGANASRQVSTFYQANIVVETDNTLQQFFGGLTNSGLRSNYEGGVIANGNAYNVYLPPVTAVIPSNFTRIDMGGCMGCHGRAQRGGDDFSFTLRGGPVSAPEIPAVLDAARLSRLRSALVGKAK
jgi:hypothetical protein